MILRVLVFTLALAFAANARAEMVLFDGARVAPIAHVGDDPAIVTAAELLARDLTQLTGQRPSVSNVPRGIIIGVHTTPAIAALLRVNRIDPRAIAGKWETYGRAVVTIGGERALLIYGSDVRGAVYGVIDLTGELGVSPWEWWADVAIQPAARLAVSDAPVVSREPSVRYRGIFLNDEDWGLQPWAARTYESEVGDIGPRTYARIFELMWRLKANTIWPAMHDVTAPFFTIPGNAEAARRYAIIVGSSHAEPMLRNNVREWDEARMGPFNYFTNRDRMRTYWRDRAVDARPLESIFTIGLRGVHDQPMQGADSVAAQREAMARVITDQRAILSNVYQRQPPQAFTAYSEVLDIYDSGLSLPDDVTLVWPDDNYGYIRRLSDTRERSRGGGAGIYYHASYWGRPHDYLWLGTTHPALIHEQMQRAYTLDARQLWILNVGDIKPIEYATQLFLDLGFDARLFDQSPRLHLQHWIAAQFGSVHAEEIANLLWRYYDLAFERRPEFMGWSQTEPTTPIRTSSYVANGDGFAARARIEAYGALLEDTQRLQRTIPGNRRDAFHELIVYPIRAAAMLNSRILNLDLAHLYARQGRASANDYVNRARGSHAVLVQDARVFNDQFAEGKWRGMMDIAPRRLPVFAEPGYPAFAAPTAPGCGLALQGGSVLSGGGAATLEFNPDLRQQYALDLFHRSPRAGAWRATTTAPWIRLSDSQSRFVPPLYFDVQLYVTIARDAPPNGEGEIRFRCEGSRDTLTVRVRVSPAASSVASFTEANRLVVIGAAHADDIGSGWGVIEGLGHSGAVLRSDLQLPSSRNVEGSPVVQYRFATHSAGPARLRAIALPTHPLVRGAGVRIAVSIDGAPPVALDFQTHGRSDAWKQNVLANTAIAETELPMLTAGAHRLDVYALDPGVMLDRFEIAFSDARTGYAPPAETRVLR